MVDSTYRVTFERDDGQEYGVGARVSVHAMNGLFRTLAPDPSNGAYRVTRCERIRAAGWRALRISLRMVSLPGSNAAFAPVVGEARGRGVPGTGSAAPAERVPSRTGSAAT